MHTHTYFSTHTNGWTSTFLILVEVINATKLDLIETCYGFQFDALSLVDTPYLEDYPDQLASLNVGTKNAKIREKGCITILILGNFGFEYKIASKTKYVHHIL